MNGPRCEHLGIIGKQFVEVGLALGVEFPEGIVDEQDGDRSANLAQERKLGQAQGKHKAPLLPLGSEVAGIPRIEQETKIVAMRTSWGGPENAISFLPTFLSVASPMVMGVLSKLADFS